MVLDFRNRENGALLDADLCIIGSGAAGITIARELIGSEIRVCLVESGGLELDSDTQALYEGESRGEPSLSDPDVTRLRYFGGTTNHWGGWCTPLHELDFQPRPWVPFSGWSISRTDLDPFYARAQSVLQLGPYVYDQRAWKFLDVPPVPLDEAKIQPAFWQARSSGPLRFGEVYREDLRNADNIQVYLHANVTNIRTNDMQTRVEHVEVKTLDGKSGKIKANFYILACGGMENARILLLSNDVNARGIGNGHDLVGRYFMEHPHVICGVVMTEDTDFLFDRFYRRRYGNVFAYAGFRTGEEIQRAEQVLNCSATVQWIADPEAGTTAAREIWLDVKDGRFPDDLGDKLWKVVGDLDSVAHQAYRRFVEGRRAIPKLKLIYLMARSEQAPNPDSRIALSTERDALGLNRIRIDWRLNDQDKRTIRVMTQAIGSELGRLNMGRVRLADWLLEDGPTWSPDTTGGSHHMGTTRMSYDPKSGVTTADCRVHGIENLYVAGSSVFPTSGYSHPTYTIVALAIRLADHIKARFA